MIFMKFHLFSFVLFSNVIFQKFIMALHVFISTVLTNQENFPFQIFNLSKRERLHQNLTNLSSYPCEQNLSTYNMSDESNQENLLLCIVFIYDQKSWDFWCKYQINRQNIYNAGLGKKKTIVIGEGKEFNFV